MKLYATSTRLSSWTQEGNAWPGFVKLIQVAWACFNSGNMRETRQGYCEAYYIPFNG